MGPVLLRRIQTELAQQGLGGLDLRAGFLASDEAEHHLGERAQGKAPRGVAHGFVPAQLDVKALADLAPGSLPCRDLAPARKVRERPLARLRFAGLRRRPAQGNCVVVGSLFIENIEDTPQVLGPLVEEAQAAGLVPQEERRGRERLARGLAFLEKLHRCRERQRLHRRALRITKAPAAAPCPQVDQIARAAEQRRGIARGFEGAAAFPAHGRASACHAMPTCAGKKGEACLAPTREGDSAEPARAAPGPGFIGARHASPLPRIGAAILSPFALRSEPKVRVSKGRGACAGSCKTGARSSLRDDRCRVLLRANGTGNSWCSSNPDTVGLSRRCRQEAGRGVSRPSKKRGTGRAVFHYGEKQNSRKGV